MTADRVTLTREDDGVAVLTMQDEPNRNAFTEPFVDQLLERLREASDDRDNRVIILRGLKDVWCAGAHEDLLMDLAEGDMDAGDILLSKALLDVPIPVIAAMEGHAVGGGALLHRHGRVADGGGRQDGVGVAADTHRQGGVAVVGGHRRDMLHGHVPVRGEADVEIGSERAGDMKCVNQLCSLHTV